MEFTVAQILVFVSIISTLPIIIFYQRREFTDLLKKANYLFDECEELKEKSENISKDLSKLKKEHGKAIESLKKLEGNPDGSLEALNDLMVNKNVVLKVTRIDPSEIFLRSPRER